MTQVLINLLKLKALSTSAEVYLGLFAVWVLMLLAGLGSVFSRRRSGFFTVFWTIVLVCLPVVGMFLYCVASLFLADYSSLKVLGLGRKQGDLLVARDAPRRPKIES